METLSEDQWRLVVNNFDLVRQTVNIYRRRHSIPPKTNVEDLDSVAVEGLITAARLYKAEKGKFRPYAMYGIRRKCISLARKQLSRRRRFPLQLQDLTPNNGNDVVDPNTPCPAKRAEQLELLRVVVGQLSPEERLFVGLRYVLGLKQETAGELAFGAKKAAVSSRCKKLKRRIRKKLSPQ